MDPVLPQKERRLLENRRLDLDICKARVKKAKLAEAKAAVSRNAPKKRPPQCIYHFTQQSINYSQPLIITTTLIPHPTTTTTTTYSRVNDLHLCCRSPASCMFGPTCHCMNCANTCLLPPALVCRLHPIFRRQGLEIMFCLPVHQR